ncbi:MAG TPA: glucuronate isomerase, partial [Pantoea sp.]|nr:glucuronate isomerase [Pantoea sp.]
KKFGGRARTVPNTIGNALYHSTHLELRLTFVITVTLLSERSEDTIWHRCNELLAQDSFTTRGIMQQMKVKKVGTTDNPLDDLRHHHALAQDSSFTVKVLPSWRPDKAFNIEAETFLPWIETLEQLTDISVQRFDDLRSALYQRLDHFAAHGCKVSDHALDVVCYAEADDATLDGILARRRSGTAPNPQETAQFKTAVLVWLGSEYARRGWVQQYHIGALRNTNPRQYQLLGPDVGFDSINDQPLAEPLARLLGAQNLNNALPKTILYCLNPRDNEVLATMAGNFQGEGQAGKMQFGSAWWFNDQLDGMQRQMTQLAQIGLLSRFVGMLTDSRSFLSYTRHEYFRRLLCQMIGRWVEQGEAPADEALLGEMVQNICFNNARDYFGIELGA